MQRQEYKQGQAITLPGSGVEYIIVAEILDDYCDGRTIGKVQLAVRLARRDAIIISEAYPVDLLAALGYVVSYDPYPAEQEAQ